MNSFLPFAKQSRKLTAVMLALVLSGGTVRNMLAEEEDPGPVDRVVNFFKSLEEKRKERERARKVAPVRAVPVEDTPPATPRTRSSSRKSESRSLDTPPSTQSSKRKKATSASNSKRSTAEQKSRARETAVAESERETESGETEAQESSPAGMKPPADLEAARKELAELKRKVAALEEHLGEAGGQGDPQVTGNPIGQSLDGVGSTTPLPAPINPPRNVATTPAYESKKPFSNGAEVTLKLPEQGVNSPNAGAPPTTGDATTPPPATTDAVPVGTKTDKPGIVKSPHPPFNEIDVNGLQKGVLAKDPTTQKIFRVP